MGFAAVAEPGRYDGGSQSEVHEVTCNTQVCRGVASHVANETFLRILKRGRADEEETPRESR
jgi:hypothetical protein